MQGTHSNRTEIPQKNGPKFDDPQQWFRASLRLFLGYIVEGTELGGCRDWIQPQSSVIKLENASILTNYGARTNWPQDKKKFVAGVRDNYVLRRLHSTEY